MFLGFQIIVNGDFFEIKMERLKFPSPVAGKEAESFHECVFFLGLI